MPTPDDQLARLHADLERLLRPSIAKCSAPSWDEQCERRAAAIYETVCHDSRLSGAAIARRIKRCERMQRDYCDGSRQIPLSILLKLPRRSVLRLAVELVAYAETLSADEDIESARGAA